MKRIAKILAMFFIALVMASTAAGKIITVDDDGPADFNNIQAAIDNANDGDTVLVADGVYRGKGNRDIDFKGKAITVRSENGPETCIIDCSGTEAEPHRGFNFQSGEGPNSVVSGLSITNGYAPESQIGSKRISGGGAIYCFLSSPTIADCVVTNNQAGRIGGGVACYKSNSKIYNCIISHNTSYDSGGGIYHYLGDLTIRNCIIIGNSVLGVGSGITCYKATISHCTIANNSANVNSGGISCNPHIETTINNCILWANSPSQMFGNASVSYSAVQGDYPGTGNIDVDPLFEAPTIDDYHLSVHSPCINAGDPMYSSAPEKKT